MSEDQTFEKGQTVTFTGYTAENEEDYPENHALLTEGETYEVAEISDDDGNDVSYFLAAPNPDFDETKRASKKANPATKLVDVFADEIAATDEIDEQEEMDLDGEEEEDEEEMDEEEELPVAAAPAKASKKTSKKTSKKKAAVSKKTTKKAASKKTTSKKTTSKKATSKKKASAKTREEVTVEYTPEGDIALTDAMQSKDVMALIAGKTAGQMIKVAQAHAKDAMMHDWTLGGILYNVKTSGAYKKVQDKKYDVKGGWASFVDEQIGLDYRKAQYLVDIYAKFTRFGVKQDVAARIGWSKASRISAVMNHDNAEELVEVAEEQSFRDLEDTVKTEFSTKGASKGTRIKKLSFRFRLVEEGGAVVQDYLEQARVELGLDSLDDTFQHVVTEWAQEKLNLKSKRTKGKGRGKAAAATAKGNGTTAQQEATA